MVKGSSLRAQGGDPGLEKAPHPDIPFLHPHSKKYLNVGGWPRAWRTGQRAVGKTAALLPEGRSQGRQGQCVLISRCVMGVPVPGSPSPPPLLCPAGLRGGGPYLGFSWLCCLWAYSCCPEAAPCQGAGGACTPHPRG